ncbi:Ldh family oxidoreductase [Aliirhizobium smilacinae]|uniref:Ldh family oxidoreductase n=1 Tax=Aliirhizobium smilacinae TaxID=1395944 RepID=A0A5C4XK68_9HYPH|nr:Ldh family oxidoreductase [Rhizobium smilacinae]TNM63955.1 Ldh family oxidoreductase [Rhizobium smilacinae]
MDASHQTVSLSDLDRFCRDILKGCGANEETANATTRAMMHATRCGVDSHGVRLLAHYVKALEGGRLNKTPNVQKVSGFGAVETLDADHAQGAVGAYAGMDRAIDLAKKFGIGAVGIRNNSHFGAAGAFSIEAARQGLIGLSFCNSDSFVRLHDGASRFHGTNPISMAVPVAGDDPWLLDMATSAVPFNRVLLYRSTGTQLPQGVASDEAGINTTDPNLTEMLAPLGDAFGFKGAGLAGIAEIFSAVLTGMRLSFDIPSMMGEDMQTPRQLGAFVIAIQPEAFVDRATFEAGMQRYVETLRTSPARAEAFVMAPGDREWKVAGHREANGVELDPVTRAAFLELSGAYGVSMPA